MDTSRDTIETVNATPLQRFRASLASPDIVRELREGLIGEGKLIEGPFGLKPLLYADYVASGRALRQVESFVMEEVLPYYANSHTEASYCGGAMTRMRREGRATIGRLVGADADCAVIFTGSGATAGINRLVSLLGVADAAQRGENPLVIVGPYEHHSNILPWRESGAEVIEIAEAAEGGPDLGELEATLARTGDRSLRIGAFSAASNVTGITTDTDAVTALLKRHGALAVWDYAGGGPYMPMNMARGEGLAKDAIVLSPHKFVGGPGASGILVVRKSAVTQTRPSWPGGGTVSFVSPWGHDYVKDLAAREEAGTPNVVGDIRAVLAFLVKDAVGQAFIDRRHAELNDRALAVWSQNPRLKLLGVDRGERLPIFSMRVLNGEGGFVHHQLFTRMLSDCFGIQARGGCACAGPYAHRLLGIDEDASNAIRASIGAGQEIEKPGWVRLNLSFLMDDAKADFLIRSLDQLARDPSAASAYQVDVATAKFRPADKAA
ncbi:aminotransferase class V-fold PLP-dependent enzyme [Kaistia defluvii]|uniref:aminotransferase class V-fold PLP-dependent enzyme n=1 Tax=Kaistia defluvii TaxID=410841 RepID=UPI002251C30D|nr:aminotransferase class V-fold PLP-dependent enzyme [Kaistia defluvii]MCX5517373.1 aminotransferase class V-fold PLP-dependent enzyme [Kaistia defluvii]